ncbi:MAG: ABC transporter ATP-binding protein [Balneolaceae bacterium]|nr:ABC transporter ATP-binding protein [Balneolaceae bacterium]
MIHFRNVHHVYPSQTEIFFPDLRLNEGNYRVILGNSGSGKTTMLHILAGLLRPTNGEVWFDDMDLYKKKEAERDRFRGQYVGVVFQQVNLIPALTISENIMLAQYMANHPKDRNHILELLDDLDIADKADSYPHELSYGQSQRAGIARAVVNNPKLLLVDEPTSNLDDRRSNQVLSLLKKQAAVHNSVLIIATHDQRVKDQFPNCIITG